MTEQNAEGLDQIPEVARQALTSLRGTPLSMTEQSQHALIDLLSLAGGEDLRRETYGLVSLARWLFEGGQKDACYQVMDVANTATLRLEDHNASLTQAAEAKKKQIERQLGKAQNKAPRYGDDAPEGSIALSTFTASVRRKIG